MTPEKINQAIAEACGWKWWKFTRKDGSWWTVLLKPGSVMWAARAGFDGVEVKGPEGERPDASGTPYYFADLNACMEMEETLDVNIDDPDSPRYAYCHELYRIVPKGQQPFRALAPQRCEAFLRLKGKWVE